MYNYLDYEKKWQERWNKEKIGEVDLQKDKPKFFIIWAYLTVSGFHHIGHMRGFSYADAIARYKRMLGYNVLLPAGGHASGNSAVAKAMKVKENDLKTIEDYKSYGLTEEDLKQISTTEGFVEFFSKKYIIDYKDYGFIGDWRRFTVTTNKDYQKFIEWQFKKLKENNLLIQKPYYATACVKCGPVAVDPSEMDLSKGGTAQKHEYTIVKLKFQESNEYVVVATLRPETMFGQTNVWLDYNKTYVKIKVADEIWIASKDFAEKLKYQKEDVVIVGQIEGKKLVGKNCLAPLANKEIIILPSDFCDEKVGTGIVTSVPSDAPIDWMGLYDLQQSKELCDKYDLDYEIIKQIEPIPIIQSKGYGKLPAIEICQKLNIKSQKDTKLLEQAKQEVYKKGFHTGVMLETCQEYKGLKVEDAKEKIKQKLISNNQADIFYDLSEEVVCRCGEKVVVKKVDDQWFIRYSDKNLTQKTIEHVKNMTILPEQSKKNFPNILNWFEDRACARQGNWLGTRFPFDESYTIEPISDSTLYPIFYLISLYTNQKIITPEQLTEEFFDYVFLNKGDLKEISLKTKIKEETLNKIKKDVSYWYPLDINLGGKEHQTVHFPVFLMNHVGLLPEKYFPQGIFINWWVVSKGGKISKSKGGVGSIKDEAKKYSVDAMRLFYANVANIFTDITFDEEDLNKYKQRLEKIYSFITSLKENKLLVNNKTNLDEWLISRFNIRLENINKSMDNIEFKTVTDDIYFNIYNDFMWYINRGGNNKQIINDLLNKWVLTFGLFTPHLAEEINELLGNKYLVSTSCFPKVDVLKISKELEDQEKQIEEMMSDIRTIIKMSNLNKLKKITLFVAEDWKYSLYDDIKELFKETSNVGQIIPKLTEKYIDHKKEVGMIVSRIFKNRSLLTETTKEQEITILTESKEFLEKTFDSEVVVSSAEEIQDVKAKQALPGKVGIIVE
jgi:leucyl-tRNA synthetase